MISEQWKQKEKCKNNKINISASIIIGRKERDIKIALLASILSLWRTSDDTRKSLYTKLKSHKRGKILHLCGWKQWWWDDFFWQDDEILRWFGQYDFVSVPYVSEISFVVNDFFLNNIFQYNCLKISWNYEESTSLGLRTCNWANNSVMEYLFHNAKG